MGLRDRVYDLQTEEEVDEFLEQFPTGVIFKAGGCHKTMQAFAEAEEALEPYEDMHVGFIRVVEYRPASNHVAQITGIQHESPQFILFVDGEAVFDVDNWEVTAEAIGPALEEYLGIPEAHHDCCGGHCEMGDESDLSSYVDLLQEYIEGDLSESQFKSQWLTTFQGDASPRTKREVELLNGLFGDVDRALAGGGIKIGRSDPDLKQRAEALLDQLV